MAGSEEEEGSGVMLVHGLDHPKVVHWEELQQSHARLCSLSSAVNQSLHHKDRLRLRLHPIVQAREASLCQANEIEQVHQKVDEKKLVLVSILAATHSKLEQLENRRRDLMPAITDLLGAHKRLQEATSILAGERCNGHLSNLQKMLRMRQQCMVAQVSGLYPVKSFLETGPREKDLLGPTINCNSVDGIGSPSSGVPRAGNTGLSSLTISGLRIHILPMKKMNFFSDKKEVQKSATALGYVAHATLLVASCLDVPLRYPLRLGGSRSYIFDYAPSIEPLLDSLTFPSKVSHNVRPTEFPLFLDGQDTTRAAYAIFLLNKDLEQLLNFVGVESLGPRHLLANLKELYATIQSQKFVDIRC